jgi:radical SAM protein with 4Fe4S-binding SPASM domain
MQRRKILDTTDKRYSAPDRFVVVPRNDWFIFFDPVHFSYTRVNEHGKAILESVGKESTVKEIASKVASKYGIDPADIESQVLAFLENMTSTRFLHEGPYRPEVGTPDMDDVKPNMLYLHPTFKCNLKCIYCYNKEDRKETGHTELSSEEWFDVLNQAKELGVDTVVFTGGEPLLRKDTLEIAKYANGIGMSSQVLTNSTLINERNVKEIVATFCSVGLSLDSHIRERNDFLRGKGSYEKTIRAIRLLKEHDRSFTIKAVITKHNVDDIPGLHQFFLEEFNCGNISASLYVPTSPGDTELLPGLDEYREATARANEVVESFYGDDHLSVMRFHGVPMRQFQCGAASAEFGIAPDGSVYPCQALLKDEFRAGNIKERSLRGVFYESPIMRRIRHCTVDEIETCRECDVKGICAGGCRSLAYNLYGKIDCHNAYFCDFLKDVAYNVLWRASCIPIERLTRMREESQVEESTKP